MSDFQVNRRNRQEPSGTLFGRVIVAFVLFAGGLVLIGIGSAAEEPMGPFLFVGGILAVALGFGLPMIGGYERLGSNQH
jgi:small-conductance mechanosensitive channel